MMKGLFMIGALAMSTTAFGQAVPNGGFEDWNDMGMYEDPEAWTSLNMMTAFGLPVTVSRSSDAYEGSYSAMIETVVEDFDGDGNNDTMPGMMYVGSVDFANEVMTEGAPFSDRPDSLTGWFKYLPNAADMFHVEVVLTKWNSAIGLNEEVGGAEFAGDAATDWSRFSVPLQYTSGETPDSVRMMIISSTVAPAGGTALFIDGMAFVTNSSAATPELQGAASIVYYPNPANGTLTVIAERTETIEIYNTLGKLVGTVKANASEKTQVSTESYRNGVYFLKTASGELHRFVVQH